MMYPKPFASICSMIPNNVAVAALIKTNKFFFNEDYNTCFRTLAQISHLLSRTVCLSSLNPVSLITPTSRSEDPPKNSLPVPPAFHPGSSFRIFGKLSPRPTHESRKEVFLGCSVCGWICAEYNRKLRKGDKRHQLCR